MSWVFGMALAEAATADKRALGLCGLEYLGYGGDCGNQFMDSKTKRHVRVWVGVLLLASLLALVPNAFFAYRHHRWESQVVRGVDGVIESSRPFVIGEGDVAILLVHGFGDGPGAWERLAPALAEEGFHVRAMRLPGWGEPLSVKRDLSPGDWEEAIQQEIATLRKAHDAVIVAGHSLGGCLTAGLAMQLQLDADALILYAPMVAVSDARSPVLSSRRWFEIGRAIHPQRMVVESLFDDHLRTANPRPRTQRDPFVPLSLFSLLYEAIDSFHEAPAVIAIPVRVVLPGRDDVVSSYATRKWLERLEAPDITLLDVNDAGHVLPLDMNAEAEAQAIRSWWEQQGAD